MALSHAVLNELCVVDVVLLVGGVISVMWCYWWEVVLMGGVINGRCY